MAGALLGAGLSGVERGLRLPEPVDGDPHLLTEQERSDRDIVRLPESLSEATRELAASEVLREAMGDELHDAVVAVRRAEAEADEGRPMEELIAEHFWRF
jgi:glutamine synthetase